MARGLKAHYPGVGSSLKIQTSEIEDGAITAEKLAPGVGGGTGGGGTLVRSITSTAVAANQDVAVATGALTFRSGNTTYTVVRTVDTDATPGATKIPVADSSGKLAAGWGGAASTLATLNASAEVVEPARKISTTALAEAGDARIINGTLSFQDEVGFQSVLRGAISVGPVTCSPPGTDNAVMALNLQDSGHGKSFYVTNLIMRVGTLPAAGDSFQFNLVRDHDGTFTDAWVADQTFASTSNLLTCRKTADSGTTYTDQTTEVNGAGTVSISEMDTVANGDWLVVGYTGRFGAINVAMDGANVNAVTSTLTAEYWSPVGGGVGVPGWKALPSVTDGTDNAGATFGKTGVIAFSQPADWIENTVDGVEGYHVRLSVSAALTAGTAIDGATLMRVAGDSSNYELNPPMLVPAADKLHLVTREVDSTADDITVVLRGDFA